MDFMLGRYAEAAVEAMADDELTIFETVMVLPDPVLTAALVDGVGEFDAPTTEMLSKIRKFHQDKAK
jgi:succinate dehydrogenase flavin-adding protein (antitoxin of CptAB toxin-antitoxin module)